MITAEQSTQVKDLLAGAHSILVVLGSNPTTDQLATGTALTLGLQAQGKQVYLLSPTQPQPISDALAGLNFLQTELGNKDLAISFAYQPESVDKVSYHIDDQSQRFFLIIKPQKGQSPLKSETVEFSYTGAEADLIFLIGVHSLESLEHLYFGYEQLYRDTTTVVFHTFETNIGSVKLNTSGTSSLSEAMALFLQELEVPLSAEMATNLLLAIEEVTDGFKSLATTADTFEVVAQLLRFGARRIKPTRSSPLASPPGPVSITPSTPHFAQALKTNPESKKPAMPNKPNNNSKKKTGGLNYQPGEFSVGGRS